MLVAHNPGLADLAHHFASEVTHMPTCAVVELTFDAPSWADFGAAMPTHVVVDVPNPA
jgi:phosphohistidine phosphatase